MNLMWMQSLFFGNSKRISSSVEALRKFAPKVIYEAVRREESDLRYVIQHTSRLMGVAEVEMLTRIAKKLRLPLETNIEPIDIGILPSGVTISDLRRCGAIALISHGQISGFVCIEPALLAPLLSRMGVSRPDIRLGTWFSIARALDQSDRQAREQLEREQEELERRKSETSIKVIRLMITDAQSYGATCVHVDTRALSLTYSFNTKDGKPARGALDNRIREAIVAVLNRWITQDSGQILLGESVASNSAPKGSGDIALRVRELETPGIIELCWIDGNAQPYHQPSCEGASGAKEELALQPQSAAQIIPLFPAAGALPPQHTVHNARSYVLLIDDNPTFAKVLSRFLERSGISSVHVAGGSLALKHLAESSALPSLVVCDVHMPDMNGFEFLKRIRCDERLRGTPVIMLTSDNDVETELSLIQSGADVFLTKTEDPRILCAHAQRLIQHRSAA